MEVVIGSRRMVDRARLAGVEAVVFDSSGLIQPPYGRVLKYHKLELLRPQFIVAIEQADELTPITSWLAGCWDSELLHTRPPVGVRSVPTSERTRYRQAQYQRYFSDATTKSFKLKELCLYPPGFLNGRAEPTGLLVGLQDKGWNTVAVGIVESAGQDTVEIYAPYPLEVRIRGLVAGHMKLSLSGVELERIRPRQIF
jgi:polynucleotide 5'-kinase involved in rRNA processing